MYMIAYIYIYILACAVAVRSQHVRLASSWVGARVLCARLCLPVLGLEPVQIAMSTQCKTNMQVNHM